MSARRKSEEITEEEKLEALKIIAAEWNQFRVPEEIDARITDLYWEEKKEKEIVLAIIYEFDAQECYARKCYWFSSANEILRKEEEQRGAYYNSGMCKPSCVPRRFRKNEWGDMEPASKPSPRDQPQEQISTEENLGVRVTGSF
ncbi:hypothetical protein [Algoriphagus namhaensis]